MFTAKTIVSSRCKYPVHQTCLGTLKMTPDALSRGVHRFSMVDTAKAYGNEAEVGRILRETGRLDAVSVMTKLHAPCLKDDRSLRAAVEDSTEKLGKVPEYILVHGPYPDVPICAVLKQLERMKTQGLVREWGVSNFSREHMQFLKEYGLTPAVDQVEYSPFFQQSELLDYCQANGITLQAYRPLAEGKALQDPTIVELAAKHGVTPAKIVYSWLAQRGVSTVCKVSSPSHQDDYAGGRVDLPAEDMRRMASLHRPNDEGRSCIKGGWHVPFTADVEFKWTGFLHPSSL